MTVKSYFSKPTVRIFRKASRLLAAGLCTALAASAITGCQGKAEEEEPEELIFDVEAVTPGTGDISITGDFIGKVEADSEVRIIPKVAGDVTALFFEVGDHVNEGDLLFTVDDSGIQIQLAQAQASLDSVSASVNTAEANVEMNKYNMLYTQAQIQRSLGTADTERMRLANSVASAKYALQAAGRNTDLALEQFGLARDKFDELEDNMDDLKDNARNVEKYAESLARVRTVYKELIEMDSDEAIASLEERGIEVPEDVKDKGSAQAVANYYIYVQTGGAANSEYELGVMVSTSQNQAGSLRSQRSTLDGNKDSMRLNQIQAAIGVENSKNNILSSEDAERLAQKMLEDYDNFTMATIITGADSQLAGANVQQVSAEAGLSQARAGVRQAQAGLDAAKLQLEYTQVTSPVSGTITEKNITLNNMATQGVAAYVITSDSDQGISFNVSEGVMQAVNVGDKVSIERNGLTYEAEVTENAGVPDSNSGLFKIKARLLQDNKTLISGTNVKITLVTERAVNAMVIPVDSVYYENHTPYVYVDEGGTAVKTVIETGLSDDKSIQVISGLTPDSRVITTWNSQLDNGSKINVTMSGDSSSESLTEKLGQEGESTGEGLSDIDKKAGAAALS